MIVLSNRKLAAPGLAALVWFSTWIASNLSAATITLAPSGDTEMRQFTSEANFGNSITMVSGRLGTMANGEVRRSVIRYDFSEIPPGAHITAVSMTIQVVRVPMTPVNSFFELRRLLTDWAENDATWSSRLPDIAWEVPGADGDLDRFPFPSSSVFLTGAGTYTFSSTPTFVADVQMWVDDPASNFGYLLLSQDEPTMFTARMFGTRDDPDTSPQMTVTYVLAPPAPPVIISQPTGSTNFVGSTILFSVSATGATPLSYQWLFNSNLITGQTGTSLLLTNLHVENSGDYSVIVSNSVGSTSSLPAHLEVIVPPANLPVVNLVSPTNTAVFTAATPISFLATAEVSNSSIASVSFFLGSNLLGTVDSEPFQIVTILAPGGYRVTARALAENGEIGVSAPVVFTVVGAPTIRLTAPPTNFHAALGSNLTITASVTTNGVAVESVTFFATRFLTNSTTGEVTPDTVTIATVPQPPFTVIWQPPVEGAWVLTARVLDLLGQTVTSAPIPIDVFQAESIPPSMTLTSAPPNFARVFTNQVRFAGKATDDRRVSRVDYQVNAGPFLPASGTGQWEALVLLPPGNSTIALRSRDAAGNLSRVLTRFYTLVITNRLTIQVSEGGKVSPNLDQKSLEIGKIYRVTAKPDRGYLFESWEGAPYQGPTLNFEMVSNLVLTVTFVPNPFLERKGRYTGIFFVPESSGSFILTLNNSGTFSGKVIIQRKSFSFTGMFDTQLHTEFLILRRGLPAISANLQLNTNGVNQIIGTLSTADWTATLEANGPAPKH